MKAVKKWMSAKSPSHGEDSESSPSKRATGNEESPPREAVEEPNRERRNEQEIPEDKPEKSTRSAIQIDGRANAIGQSEALETRAYRMIQLLLNEANVDEELAMSARNIINGLKHQSSKNPQERQAEDKKTKVEDDAEAASEKAAGAELGATFTTWCRKGHATIGRYYMFEREISGFENVEIRKVYLSQGSGIVRFQEYGNGAPFWQVRVAGDYYILPEPQSRKSFRALEPVFKVDSPDVNPATVGKVMPAVLSLNSGTGVLDQQGSVA